MATNFPTSVDTLTNPVSNDSLNSPSHSAQHANANDAIEAVETYLLTQPMGLRLIKTQLLTGGSLVTITDAFSATYDAYKIVISDLSTTSAVATGFQFGTNNTGYYSNQLVMGAYNAAPGNVTFSNTNNGTSYDVGIISTTNPNNSGGYIEVQNPFGANTTTLQAFGSDPRTTGIGMRFNAGYHAVQASFTSFTYLISGATFTGGRISVYGYTKA
jgi:hypothetical protein